MARISLLSVSTLGISQINFQVTFPPFFEQRTQRRVKHAIIIAKSPVTNF